MSSMAKLIHERLHIEGEEAVEALARISNIRHVPKDGYLLQVGEVQSHVYLLMDGIVRCYFLDDTGVEVTDCFIMERGYPVMTENFNHPSLVAIQALTDMHVLEMPINEAVILMNQYPEMLWEYNRLLQLALLFHWRIGKVCSHYTAVQKLQWFQENWPGVDAVAKSTHVASFLGIAPETLSRMRRSQTGKSAPELMHVPDDTFSFTEMKKALEQEGKQDGFAAHPRC